MNENHTSGLNQYETYSSAIKKRVSRFRCWAAAKLPTCSNFQHLRVEINLLELDPKFISSSKNMHLWRKMRKVWVSVSDRLKPHKPTVEGGKDGETCNVNGLLKLQDDVKMCGYEDVQVMWNLLNSPQMKQIGAAAATAAAAATTMVSQSSSRKCNSKQWPPSWMAIFWPNQRNTGSSSSFCWVKSS